MVLRRPQLTVRNIAGVARWLHLRRKYRGLTGGRFYCGRGSRITLGAQAQVKVGHGVVALENFVAYFGGSVTIGDRVYFNEGCHLSSLVGLAIGDGCLFGEKVSIHDDNHRFGPDVAHKPLPDRGFTSAPVTIGANVWVGAKATILSGVSIGDDSVVAAHAVVNRDVPARSLVGGIPARILRQW